MSKGTPDNGSLWIEGLFQWLYLQTAFVSPQTRQGCLLWKQLPPELFPPTSTLVLLGGHSLKSHRYTGSSIHITDLEPLLPYKYFCCCFLLQMWLGNRATEIRHACRILDVLLYTIYTQNWYIPTRSLPVIHFLMSCGWNSCFGSVAPWLFFCTYTRREGNRSIGARSPPDPSLNPELPKPSSF